MSIPGRLTVLFVALVIATPLSAADLSQLDRTLGQRADLSDEAQVLSAGLRPESQNRECGSCRTERCYTLTVTATAISPTRGRK